MRSEYAAALFQGASMPAQQRARVVAELARLTGLPGGLVEDNDLRMEVRSSARSCCTTRD